MSIAPRAALLFAIGLVSPGLRAEPTSAPGAYRHDGFYARLEIGAGPFFAETSTANRSARSFEGVSISGLLALGGTTEGGLVIGGAMMRDRVVGLSGEDETTGEIELEEVSFANLLIGPFFDFYPNPASGLHVEAVLGLADLDVHRDNLAPNSQVDDDPSGVGLMIGVGWEWWVASQLSVGPLLRFAYSSLSVDESGSTTSVKVYVPSLAIGATYH